MTITTLEQKALILNAIESLERTLQAKQVPGAPEVLLKVNRTRTLEEIAQFRAEIAEFDAKTTMQ